ncbi:MAG: hypothetical protein ABI629_07935 [bacterium]
MIRNVTTLPPAVTSATLAALTLDQFHQLLAIVANCAERRAVALDDEPAAATKWRQVAWHCRAAARRDA